MPYSDNSTYPFMINAISYDQNKNTKPVYKILDCGVGSGSIGKAITDAVSNKKLKNNIEVYGLEVHSPYITNPANIMPVFHDLYKNIQHGDNANFALFLANCQENDYDCIIFGDSLEHVGIEWAEHSLYHAIRTAKLVIVNCPIKPYPQGEIFGNPWEKHWWDPSKKQMLAWGGKYLGGNETVGCFSWSGGLRTKATQSLKAIDI